MRRTGGARNEATLRRGARRRRVDSVQTLVLIGVPTAAAHLKHCARAVANGAIVLVGTRDICAHVYIIVMYVYTHKSRNTVYALHNMATDTKLKWQPILATLR